MSDSNTQSKLDYLLELSDVKGVSTASVEDGQVFVFKRSFLESLLVSTEGNETVVVFVKSEAAQSKDKASLQ